MQINSTPVVRSPYFVASLIICLIICYFAFFWQLETRPLMLWDEARVAVNSYEMAKSNNIFVTTYDGEVDLWNTKPPLLVWIQALFIKIFGASVLVVRIPSALAALATALLLFFFCSHYLKNISAGLIAVGILVTSEGLIIAHVARSADYDSLLIFFTTAAALFYYSYLEHLSKKYIYLTAVFLALAVLTKGIAGLLLLPGFLVYLFIRKRVANVFKDKHLYFSILIFLLLILGYYGIREMIDGGYINMVFKNEVFGRYNKTIEGHSGGFWYYLNLLYDYQFRPWLIFLPLILLLLNYQDQKKKFLIWFCTINIIAYYIIISISETKLTWYIAPIIPVASLGLGIFIADVILQYLQNKFAALLMIILLIMIPYRNIILEIEQSLSPQEPIVYFGKYIDHILERNPDTGKIAVLHNKYNATLRYHLYLLEENGIDVKWWHNINLLPLPSPDKEVEKFIVCDPDIQQEIEYLYNFTVIDEYLYCKSYLLSAKK